MTVEQILKEIDSILLDAKAECIKALQPVFLIKPKPDQVYSCFELFHMQNYALGYNSFFLRNGELEVDYACLPPFTGEESFLPKLASYFQDLFKKVELNEKDGIRFTAEHEKQFLKWFKEVWLAAGGDKSLVPTYFCFEREYQVQDIISGEVMSEEDGARRLGYKI
ncbi:MAG TPA: hypothetical protein VN132_07800 [Bdellovibrio sp.]|nr:hypothetical protein [Bdellovibrio sp.]